MLHSLYYVHIFVDAFIITLTIIFDEYQLSFKSIKTFIQMQDSPIILIAGQEKCGKSSIVDVVFERMSVYNTFFLDPTSSLKKYTSKKNPFLDYNIWELPSDMNEVREEISNFKPYMNQIAVLIYVFSLEVSLYSLLSYL